MKIWTLTTDDNDGTTVIAFTSEEAADAAALAWCAQRWDATFFGRPMPDSWRDAYHGGNDMGPGVADGDEWLQMDEHELDVGPVDPAVSRETRAALGQLLDQVHQMEGMFDDEDGTIAAAIADAEAALAADGRDYPTREAELFVAFSEGYAHGMDHDEDDTMDDGIAEAWKVAGPAVIAAGCPE